MKKRIIISESERQRILSKHKNVIKDESELKRQSLSEREMSKLINNVLINEALSGPKSGNELNNCGKYFNGTQKLCWACNGGSTPGCPTNAGVYTGWSLADVNQASGCGCTSWSFGMQIPGQEQKLPKPEPTTTTTTTTTEPKPISTSTSTTQTVKENSLKKLYKKIISEMNNELDESDELDETYGRPGDSCNCGSERIAGVVTCPPKQPCYCDCRNAEKWEK
jgi:hypothetical protein